MKMQHVMVLDWYDGPISELWLDSEFELVLNGPLDPDEFKEEKIEWPCIARIITPEQLRDWTRSPKNRWEHMFSNDLGVDYYFFDRNMIVEEKLDYHNDPSWFVTARILSAEERLEPKYGLVKDES